MDVDLTPYIPRLLLELADGHDTALHRVLPGTLVFADLSGFTALSERLAQAGGKAGAEEMTLILNDIFGELLGLAAARGGEMLKYGGDAVLLFFRGADHERRAVAAARDMQRRLTSIGSVRTEHGRARVGMSVGVHSGDVDFFVVGPHRDLVVAGPAPTMTAAMETAAEAGEILMSPATAAALPSSCAGEARAGGLLVARAPKAGRTPIVVRGGEDQAAAFIPRGLLPTLAEGPVQPEHRPVTAAFIYVPVDEVLAQQGGAVTALHLDTVIHRIDEVFDEYDVTFMATDLAAGGVKVIAATGLPVAQSDGEERMLAALHAVTSSPLPMKVSAAAHRGHVFAGTVGPPYRLTFTMIGDVVNTAARVLGRAEPGQVMTLAPVVERSGAEFEVSEGESFMAKGKAEPLVPLVVGAPTGARRTTGEVLPLVGRDAEMGVARGILRGLDRGVGGALDFVGEAGSGKTRLVDELVAESGPIRVVRVAAVDAGLPRPFGTVEQALRQLTRCASPEELAGRVSERAPELRPWLPLIAMAMGWALDPTPDSERLADAAVPGKIREFTRALVDACLDDPTLLVVEDLHWADQPSVAMVGALAGLGATRPLVVAVTRRPAGGPAPIPEAAEIEVSALPPSAAREMAARLVGRPLLPHQMDLLLDRADGNPLFLRELALSLAAGRDELPDRVETLFVSRIGVLDPDHRAALRAASVVGTDFGPDEVAAALEHEVHPLVWERLQPFVAPASEGRLRFRHALMRDSAYATLPFRQRREMHRRVGEHLENVNPGRIDALAHHFGSARDRERGWRYGVAAADEARSRFAFTVAAPLYEQALSQRPDDVEVHELFRVWDSQFYCLQITGNAAKALGTIRPARRSIRGRPALQARLYLLEAAAHLARGHHEAAGRAVQRGLRSEPDAHTRVRLLVVRSDLQRERGCFTKARATARDAATLAVATKDRPGEAHALSAQFNAEVRLRAEGRDVTADQAAQCYREEGLLSELAILSNLVAMDHDKSGRLKAAADGFVEAERAQSALGLSLHAAVSAFNRGLSLATAGQWVASREVVEAARITFAAAGYLPGQLAADGLCGWLMGIVGELDEGVELLRATAARCAEAGLANDAVECRLFEAEIHAQAGSFELAADLIPSLNEMATPAWRARALRLRAVVARVAGEPETSEEFLHGARRESAEADSAYEVAVTELFSAVLSGAEAADVGAARHALNQLGVAGIPLVDLAQREIDRGRARPTS